MKSYRKAPKNLFLKQQGVPKRTFLDIKNVIEIKSYILKLMKVENDFMNNLYDHGLPMSDN
jgi:hypothetical protein